jgi:hypothetical protein
MHKVVIILGVLIILMSFGVNAQNSSAPAANTGQEVFCLTQDEMILYNLVNDLRKQNKLSVIPLSKSLSEVSRIHIDDLLSWKPQDQGCNLHSWSDKGKWSPCCGGKDPLSSKCMAVKPAELTTYPGSGYELIYWDEEKAVPTEAFKLWQDVNASKEMILNKGKWLSYKWKALGIGIKNGYAVIWLGDKPDIASNISICGSDTLVQLAGHEGKLVSPVLPQADIAAAKKSEKKTEKEKVQPKHDKQVEETRTNTISNHLFVIVAGFKDKEQAEAKVMELIEMGYSDAIVVPSSDRFRVSIGSYSNDAQAMKRLKELRNQFADCWLLRL